jgi:hypothetical protein
MKRLLWGVVFALFLVACSGDPTPLGFVVSSSGGVGIGEQRVLFSLVDPESTQSVAAPDLAATVTLGDENGAPLDTYELEFIWLIPEVRGLYVAYLDIPEEGLYQMTIDADGYKTTAPAGLIAVADSPVVQVGDDAPLSVTRTLADYPDLSVISSDPDPDPAMYRLSIDEAVSNGRAAVIVFATPAWCTSQACGPMLDQVKALQSEYGNVDFVHVEVYEDIQVASSDELELVPSVTEWGLLAEPWVFVVDSDGVVAGSFEGTAGEDELVAAIEAVAG